MDVFAYYKDHGMNPVGQSAMGLLPEDYNTYVEKDLNSVYSKFRV
jgi:hypothetical protein